MYYTAATIRQGAKTDTGAKVLKAKLPLNSTSSHKVLAVGPRSSADAPDGSPLGAKLLYLDLPSDMPGADARRRVSVQRCKPCANPHDRGGMPKCFASEVDAIRAQQLLQEIHPVPRHPRPRLDPSSTTRTGKDLPDTNRFKVGVAPSR